MMYLWFYVESYLRYINDAIKFKVSVRFRRALSQINIFLYSLALLSHRLIKNQITEKFRFIP